MSTMTERSYRERRLGQHLHALRHLPPNARLSPLPDPAEQQMLDDLLNLPDAVDVLRWLRDERGSVIARIALREELRHLERIVVGMRRAEQAGREVDGERHGTLTEYAQIAQGLAPLPSLEERDWVSSEGLRSILRQYQQLGHQPATLSSEASRDAREQLLYDLLQLPVTRDPLHWLEAERGDLAASISLESILATVLPSGLSREIPGVRIRRPRGILRAPRGLHIVIDELAFGPQAFSLVAHLRISGRMVLPPPGAGRLTLTWLGFERVQDDRGYSYVPEVEELSVGSTPWWSRERLRMAFTPAVALEARELTFLAAPVTLEVWALQPVSRARSFPDVTVDGLSWRVPLPSRR